MPRKQLSLYDTFVGYIKTLNEIATKIKEFSIKVEDQIARDDIEGHKMFVEARKKITEDIAAAEQKISAQMKELPENEYLAKISQILDCFSQINKITGDANMLYNLISKKPHLAIIVQNFSESYAGNVMREVTKIRTGLDDLLAQMQEDSGAILDGLYAQINVIRGDPAKLRGLIAPVVTGPTNNQFTVPILRYIMSNHDIFVSMPELHDQIEKIKNDLLIEGLEELGLEAAGRVAVTGSIIERLATECGLFPDTPSMNKEALFDFIEGTASGKIVARANLIEIYKYIEGKPSFEFKMAPLFDRAKSANAPRLTQVLDYTSIAHFSAIRELNMAKLPIPGEDGIIKVRWDKNTQYTIIIETIDGEDWRALSLRPNIGPTTVGDNYFIPTTKIAQILAPGPSNRPINYHKIIEKQLKDMAVRPAIQQLVDGYKKSTLPKRDPEGIKEKISSEIMLLAGNKYVNIISGHTVSPKQLMTLVSEDEVSDILSTAILNPNVTDSEYKITQVIKLEKIQTLFYNIFQKSISVVKLPKAFSGPLTSEQNKAIVLGHLRDALKHAINAIDSPPSILREYDYSIKDYMYGAAKR